MTPATTLDGVTAPLVTPMREDGSVACDRLEPLLRHLAGGGVDHLLLFGSNGEGPLIPTGELAGFAESAVSGWQQLRPGGRVFVAVSAPGTAQAVARAAEAASARPDALVVSAPLYFAHTEDELFEHFRALHAVGLPVVAYNIPRYTGNPLGPGLIDRLLERELIVGLKDSSGDAALLASFCRRTSSHPAFGVSQGAEGALVDGLDAGAAGITPGLANLAPALCTELYRAHRSRDRAAAQRAQAALDRLSAVHRVRPGVVTTKTALELLGLGSAHAAQPFVALSDDERNGVAAVLRANGLLGPEAVLS